MKKLYRLVKAEQDFGWNPENKTDFTVREREVEDLNLKSMQAAHDIAEIADVDVYAIIASNDEGKFRCFDNNEVYAHPTLEKWRDDVDARKKADVAQAKRQFEVAKKAPKRKVIFEDDVLEYVATSYLKNDSEHDQKRGVTPRIVYSLDVLVKREALFNKEVNDNGRKVGDISNFSISGGKWQGRKFTNAVRELTEDDSKWIRPSRGWKKVPADEKPELQKKLVRQLEFVNEAFNSFRAKQQSLIEDTK